MFIYFISILSNENENENFQCLFIKLKNFFKSLNIRLLINIIKFIILSGNELYLILKYCK